VGVVRVYRLLIADDEQLERETIVSFVKKSSLPITDIIQCTTGTEALKNIMLKQPQIIIMNVNLPGIGGLEVLEEINKQQYKGKVIFSTSYPYFEYAVKAMQMGAMDFLENPADCDQVISVLQKAVQALDEEAEKALKVKQYMKTFHLMGGKIMEDLIAGQLEEEIFLYMDLMGVEDTTSGTCYCIRFITELEEAEKKNIEEKLSQEFHYLNMPILYTWKKNLLSIIIFVPEIVEREESFPVMKERIVSVLKYEGASFSLGIGEIFQNFKSIKASYYSALLQVTEPEKQGAEASEEIWEKSEEINRICDYLEKNYEKKLTLDSIAAKAGFSKFYINRLFKQYKGTTVMDYLIQYRISKAKELLKDGEYTVKQISSMVGYSEPNYFTCTFKKIEGISPVKYRFEQEKEG
jgi:YesN/AraC family two-component response regulator